MKSECSAADRKPAGLTCVSVSIYMSVLNILSNAWFVSFCFTPKGNEGEIELAWPTQQAQQVYNFSVCVNMWYKWLYFTPKFNDLVSSYESRLINAVGWIVRYAFKETNISALPYGSYTLRWTDIISIMIMKLNDFSSLQIDNKSISFFIIEKTTNAWQHNQWYHHLFLISR